MKGPIPKPTAKLKLTGSRRAAARKDEPEPEIRLPDPPEYLDRKAKAIFRSTGRKLVAQGVHAELDQECLGEFAQCASDIRRLTRLVRKEGEFITNDKGGLSKHPACLLLREAYDRMRHAGTRLGLSPADRVRVKATPVKATDGKERFFKPAAG